MNFSHAAYVDELRCKVFQLSVLKFGFLMREVFLVQTKKHELIRFSKLQKDIPLVPKAFKIMLAFSGLKQALTSNPGYNRRVEECQEAAKLLLE